jgi:alpha-1,2-mannosyltransferase
MIPSMFMAFRIVLGDGDLALLVHLALAVPVFLFALWKLWRLDDPLRRASVVLAGTALITPYLHNYDLTIVAAGALLVLRRFPAASRGELAVCGLAALALGLPQLVVVLNLIGVPLAPLVLLLLA